MPRIDLTVPFAEKDDAKRLGARWDANQKIWYVPEGINPGPFSRWLPLEPDINIRAVSYWIGVSEISCWKCDGRTRAFGFILPAGHETLDVEDDNEEVDLWVLCDSPTVLSYVTNLSPAVAERIQAMTRHYRLDFSKMTNSSYWMNHCEACGMKQGDFELFSEPGGGFFPMDEQEATRLALHEVKAPFSCSSDQSYGSHLDLILGHSRIFPG